MMPELKSNPDLPDPLTMADGSRVTTDAQWCAERRGELKTLFQHFMFGYFPPRPDAIEATVLFADSDHLGGKATLSEVAIAFGPDPMPVMRLLLAVPNAAGGPVGTFVGPNFAGNHTLTDSARVALPDRWMPDWIDHQTDNRATDAGRGTRMDRFPIEQIIDRGYAVASFYNGDLDPDKPDFTDGIHPHLAAGDGERDDHSFGTLAAWAWGLQRAVDYLLTHPAIDPSGIAAVGHSRNGKTALLAAAFDERIAMAIPHQAGCGGTSPARGTVGETVKQINDMFPHWFCDAFKQFNDRVDLLPFDLHCLIALMAPRPVLLTNAADDQWANPAGQFDMLRAAAPVYRLLRAGDLAADAMPELNRLIDSKLGYHIRPGVHAMGHDDWAVFMDFADRWL